MFHNLGVGQNKSKPDQGRFAVTKAKEDMGAFKTPTLRGVSRSAPYMHDGSLATLADVVAFYRRGGEANPERDPLMEPLELTEREASALVSFLEALSRPGGPPAAAAPSPSAR